MVYDVTDRVHEAWEYYDKMLDDRLERVSTLSGVPVEQMIKINPAEFAEKNKFQTIRGYNYKSIGDWIKKTKTGDDIFLISPLDAIEETAAQISYKSGSEITRTIRASKCDVVPVPRELALDFFIRNHRQSAPLVRESSICFGLVHQHELVSVMLYDISNGAVRGANKDYELVRLSISKGTRIHGGASKLQRACEEVLARIGVKKIYSYSNATINSGAVYEKLGFMCKSFDGGHPFVIKKDNEITRLINLYPDSTDEKLALRGWIKVHLGGNKTWVKEVTA